MFKDGIIEEYIEALASKAPVPGGGGVSALTGALAAGLARMVASLTVGKKKYAENEALIIETADKLKALTDRLYTCMEDDAQAFEPLSKAYGMPKDTEEQIAEKNRVMEICLEAAAKPPMDICRIIGEMVPLIDIVKEKGSTLAVSDAGCSAALAQAAFKAAELNVLINTRLMKNREIADVLNTELIELDAEVITELDLLYESVFDRLSN